MSATITRRELAAAIDAGTVDRRRGAPHAVLGAGPPPRAVRAHTEVAELAPSRPPGRDAAIVVYCSNLQCPNSAIVEGELLRMGYTDVRKYAEGKQEWEAAGLPLETGVAA